MQLEQLELTGGGTLTLYLRESVEAMPHFRQRPLVPAATSASFSTRAMDSRYRASSRALAPPTAPPPPMSASKDWVARFKNLPLLLPPYHSTGGRRSQGTG